jgi:hypothetical protein
MKDANLESLSPREMQGVGGGLGYAHATMASSLVNYDWLKQAAAKLRANLQVLPPVVGPGPR